MSEIDPQYLSGEHEALGWHDQGEVTADGTPHKFETEDGKVRYVQAIEDEKQQTVVSLEEDGDEGPEGPPRFFKARVVKGRLATGTEAVLKEIKEHPGKAAAEGAGTLAVVATAIWALKKRS